MSLISSKTVLATLVLTAASATFAQAATYQDRDWVNFTGTVKSVSGDEFTLNYSEGQILVEMDDHDWYDENIVVPGDRVTVTGLMDKDFFDTRSVEASSVYIDKLNTYYYASSADEEDGLYNFDYAKDDSHIGLTGTVDGINGEDFTLSTGGRELAVDTDQIGRDLVLSPGDRVSVYGEMDDADIFEGREILATSVVVLSG